LIVATPDCGILMPGEQIAMSLLLDGEYSFCAMPVRPTRVVVSAGTVTFYKHQLSLTNPRDALHHGQRAANKSDGRSV